MQALLAEAVPSLAFFFLVSLRVGAVFASLPAPFGSGAPAQVRVALALAVTGAICAPRFGEAPDVPLEPIAIGSAAVGELLVGAVIGLTVRVTLAAAEVAGNLAGLSMGQGFAATVDPAFGEQMLPVGRALSGLVILLFFALRGHHVTLSALAWSLDHAPVGDVVGRAVGPGTVAIGAGLLAQGLRIASPIVGAMFIVQLGLGLVARSAPRVQVFSLTFAITSAVGGLVLYAAAPSVTVGLAQLVGQLPAAIDHALGGT